MPKTTNYFDTFISVARDCPRETAEIPPERKTKNIARRQYEMITRHPYEHTSDNIIFGVHADKNGIPESKRGKERAQFFSKGRACLRSSPLAKRYGWGFHFDQNGKVAAYQMESPEYHKLAGEDNMKQLKAMRSSRKK